MKKYILVEWPDSQLLMEHERFRECLLVQDIFGHEEAGSAAYMCPDDLYREIFKDTDPVIKSNRRLQEILVHKYFDPLCDMVNDLTNRCYGGEEASLSFINGNVHIKLK